MKATLLGATFLIVSILPVFTIRFIATAVYLIKTSFILKEEEGGHGSEFLATSATQLVLLQAQQSLCSLAIISWTSLICHMTLQFINYRINQKVSPLVLPVWQ